ncbi:hypothetical protein ACFOWM_03475 [Ferruginibacter yonginensis]|uniref:Uncharacterized protein n=1 Tax=Ferruginibacter yonginensis TaxID=1310416 RepID=A0ABV8QP70_9BACT
MSHKQQTIEVCQQYLNDLSAGQYFNMADFNHYYRKHNGGFSPFFFGYEIADYIIREANSRILKQQEQERLTTSNTFNYA